MQHEQFPFPHLSFPWQIRVILLRHHLDSADPLLLKQYTRVQVVSPPSIIHCSNLNPTAHDLPCTVINLTSRMSFKYAFGKLR